MIASGSPTDPLQLAHHSSPMVIPLWPNGAPGSETWTQQEEETILPPTLKIVRNVTQPTLTAYFPPPEISHGVAVIVCPGGAFHFLSIDMEGVDVAHWLNAHGIAAFVLKYRLIRTGDDLATEVREHLGDRNKMGELLRDLHPLVVADGQQAVRVVREHATRWGLMPERIGMLGFSAGAMVTTSVVFAHDNESRLNFAGAIYSGGSEDVSAPADAPPLFVLCAADDDMASARSLQLYTAWRDAKRPVELHIYSTGGHGFGMRKQGMPSDAWIERFYDWLQSQDFL